MNSLQDAIKSRVSIRSYIDKPIAKIKKRDINRILKKSNQGPCGNRIRFALIDLTELSKMEALSLGTYGNIKGASLFLAGAVKPGRRSMEDFGYCMEKVILYATRLGYGTCWQTGTFKREGFERQLNISPGEIVPGMTPIGYFQHKKKLSTQILELMAATRKRKAGEELFFDALTRGPLSSSIPGGYAAALEAVQAAPSSSNKQPWRIYREGELFHFYLQPTPGYGDVDGRYNLQNIDMGIAMCHFELALGEEGEYGRWEELPSPMKIRGQEYIITWLPEEKT